MIQLHVHRCFPQVRVEPVCPSSQITHLQVLMFPHCYQTEDYFVNASVLTTNEGKQRVMFPTV